MAIQSFSWSKFNQNPIVGILRGYTLEEVLKIAEVYEKSGFYTMEITMNTEGVTEIIAQLRQNFSELNIGAGTVCNLEDLDRALDAGAQFIVTPIISEDVITACVQKNIPIFPGAYSPSEIYKAHSLGASAVKVFPTTQLGPRYIKDVLAPLDNLKLLPTGGVDLDNIASFFEAGAIGAGLGNTLFDTEMIKNGDFDQLGNHFKAYLSNIKGFL